MSVALSFLGTEWTSPDHAIGFGTAITNPSTALSSMITGQLYYQEGSGDIDVIFVKGGDKYMIALYKSFVNQKLLQQFVFSVHQKEVCHHRPFFPWLTQRNFSWFCNYFSFMEIGRFKYFENILTILFF